MLEKLKKQYYEGDPIVSDEVYDALEDIVGTTPVGYSNSDLDIEHLHRMYSLKKYHEGKDKYKTDGMVKSLKLDGSAIAIQYKNGAVKSIATRGNGIKGKDITRFAKCLNIPSTIPIMDDVQIGGELLAAKDVPNARNVAAGASGLHSVEEFKKRNLTFVAYSTNPTISDTYTEDMNILTEFGFSSVLTTENLDDKFPNDGYVYRLDSNKQYESDGFTAHHPRGAFAVKNANDVEVKVTTLREVTWQVGRTGQVTPVGHFDEVEIEGAKVNKASLKNIGIINKLGVEIGSTIAVTRAGGIIPEILCVIENEQNKV